MGKVSLLYRIIPDVEKNREELLSEINKKLEEIDGRIEDSKEKPLAFGLVEVELLITAPEREESVSDLVENIFRSIDGISSFELERISRV